MHPDPTQLQWPGNEATMYVGVVSGARFGGIVYCHIAIVHCRTVIVYHRIAIVYCCIAIVA